MKYIISQISGKQFIFQPGFWYDIDYIKNSIENSILNINKILFIKNEEKFQLGNPFINKCNICAKVLKHTKAKKIMVLKTKPKKNYTRKKGHRQKLTRIYIFNKQYGT